MKFLLFLVFNLLVLIAFSQSREELEKKRRASIQEIEYTNKLIEETESNKKSSYNKLLLISSKISTRETIINSYRVEIQYLINSIETHEEIIIELENDLAQLKSEYAKLIYYSYLHRNKYDKLMFILASDDINTAFRRIKYLQQYSKYRMDQAAKIEETKIIIRDKIVQLEILKDDKTNLLAEEDKEKHKLFIEKQEKDQDVKLLGKKERELKIKLQKQNEIANKLKNEIARIIEEEARLAAAKLNNKSGDYFQLTPEEKMLASIFSKNQAKLPWPTERGVVTGKFGEQPHPFLKGIKIRNDGVDISTTEGSKVRAIYDGKVSRIFAISGAHKTVIIRHGNFLTVYSNLKEVTVNQGDVVKTKQVIGTVYTEVEKDHKTVLQFQIWKENEKLNPLEWLAKGSDG